MSISNPKVAVITRTKDRVLLLERALQSVHNQSMSDFVHVIINDGGDPGPVEPAGTSRVEHDHPVHPGLPDRVGDDHRCGLDRARSRESRRSVSNGRCHVPRRPGRAVPGECMGRRLLWIAGRARSRHRPCDRRWRRPCSWLPGPGVAGMG